MLMQRCRGVDIFSMCGLGFDIVICPQVSSVQWSMTRQEQVVLSSSWDETIRLWDPQAMACLNVFNSQRGNIYAASWSPQRPHTFASVACM